MQTFVYSVIKHIAITINELHSFYNVCDPFKLIYNLIEMNSVLLVMIYYITLHYITSFHTPITPTVTNGASTKSFKFSECELKKKSFQKFFEGISVCEFLEIGRKRIPCIRSGERETPLAEL